MKLSLIDLHCDTLFEIVAHNKEYEDPSLAICLTDPMKDTYSHYGQIAAFWSDFEKSDEECFSDFKEAIALLNTQSMRRSEFEILKSFSPDKLTDPTATPLILAVEDARLLAGSIERLHHLYSVGVRLLTLVWKGNSCIGGAFDTANGLTEFGKEAVRECTRLGIIPDISHASQRSAYDILEAAGTFPVVASHPDALAVHSHPRNLSDELFSEIKNRDGLVGINLYTEHLGCHVLTGSDVDVTLRHVDHFLSLGGEDVLCFGCDFDGAQTPSTLQHPRDLTILGEEMLCRGISQATIEKLFWKNAQRFLLKNIFNSIS